MDEVKQVEMAATRQSWHFAHHTFTLEQPGTILLLMPDIQVHCHPPSIHIVLDLLCSMYVMSRVRM